MSIGTELNEKDKWASEGEAVGSRVSCKSVLGLGGL